MRAGLRVLTLPLSNLCPVCVVAWCRGPCGCPVRRRSVDRRRDSSLWFRSFKASFRSLRVSRFRFRSLPHSAVCSAAAVACALEEPRSDVLGCSLQSALALTLARTMARCGDAPHLHMLRCAALDWKDAQQPQCKASPPTQQRGSHLAREVRISLAWSHPRSLTHTRFTHTPHTYT